MDIMRCIFYTLRNPDLYLFFGSDPDLYLHTRHKYMIFVFIEKSKNDQSKNQKAKKELIWGWSNGWLGILEFAPPKVSCSIPSSANFGGLSPYKACSGFKRGPRKGGEIVPLELVGPWIGYRVFFLKKKKAKKGS